MSRQLGSSACLSFGTFFVELIFNKLASGFRVVLVPSNDELVLYVREMEVNVKGDVLYFGQRLDLVQTANIDGRILFKEEHCWALHTDEQSILKYDIGSETVEEHDPNGAHVDCP